METSPNSHDSHDSADEPELVEAELDELALDAPEVDDEVDSVDAPAMVGPFTTSVPDPVEHRIAPGSGLYVGKVRHRRFFPKKHDLSYRVWHLLLDVDDLWRLDEKVKGFRHNRRGLVEFRDTDHFGPGPGSVKSKLAAFLEANGRELPGGRILVLTYPRVLGHVFNPVSFWFCHDASGNLDLVVAEVNNTFGDSYSYILDELEDLGGERVRASATKALHVSPFLPVDDHSYTFTIRRPTAEPGSSASVQLDVLQDDGERVLDATLVEERRELTTSSLRKVLWTHPLVTLHTVFAIHFHAVRIWLRGKATFHRRPEPRPNAYPGSEPVEVDTAAAVGEGDAAKAPTSIDGTVEAA